MPAWLVLSADSQLGPAEVYPADRRLLPDTYEEMEKWVHNQRAAGTLKWISLAIYDRAHEMAEERGILIADTKFEFGLLDGDT